MNSTDKDYNFRFRENIFRNNEHFFDLPPEKITEMDELAIKYGFPTSVEEERV